MKHNQDRDKTKCWSFMVVFLALPSQVFCAMDRILVGIFRSAHPDDVKKALINKVANSVAAVKDISTIQNVLHFCFQVLLESKSDFEIGMAKIVLTSFLKYHEDVAVEYLRDEVLCNGNGKLSIDILRQNREKRNRWVKTVAHCLGILRSTSSGDAVSSLVLSRITRVFLETNELEFSSEISKIMIQNWDRDIIRGKEDEIITKIVEVLKLVQFETRASNEFAESPPETESSGPQNNLQSIANTIQSATITAALLGKIVNVDTTFVQKALNEIFKVLSSPDLIPSVALAALLQHIDKDLIVAVSSTVSKDRNIKDENMTMVLCRMIDWLSWPGVQLLEIWISSLMKTLISIKKSKVVADVIQIKISQVFQAILILVCLIYT